MNIDYIINMILAGLGIVGLGVVLKYFAFMIAWGFALGNAKIPKNTTFTLGKELAELLKVQVIK